MKKIVLIIFNALVFSGIGYSQITVKPTIGLNVTDFSKDGDGNAKGKAGYQLGASVAFGKKFYIEPGLLFVGKSTKVTTAGSSEEFKADLKGFRIPVAVGAELMGSEETFFSLRVFGGPSAFLITSSGDIDKDDIKKANLGVFAGAGVDIWKIFVDLSYEWSLTNIQKDITETDFGKTRSLFLSAGLRVNL